MLTLKHGVRDSRLSLNIHGCTETVGSPFLIYIIRIKKSANSYLLRTIIPLGTMFVNVIGNNRLTFSKNVVSKLDKISITYEIMK